MRKLLFFIACLGLTAPSGAAAQSNDIEEILSRYFSTTSPNQAAEEALIRRYSAAKVSTFALQSKRSKDDCPQTVSDFTRMGIFKFELYSDGSLKTPEGKFLFPRGQKKLAAEAVRVYPRKKR